MAVEQLERGVSEETAKCRSKIGVVNIQRKIKEFIQALRIRAMDPPLGADRFGEQKIRRSPKHA
jgi:hypothetical protein